MKTYSRLSLSRLHLSRRENLLPVLTGKSNNRKQNIVEKRKNCSSYLEVQGTLWNTSRYPYLDISDLQNWGKNKSNKVLEDIMQCFCIISHKPSPLKRMFRDIQIVIIMYFVVVSSVGKTNEYIIWLLKLELYWKYCGKEEKLLLRSNFSSFPQYFIICC